MKFTKLNIWREKRLYLFFNYIILGWMKQLEFGEILFNM